MANVYRRSPWAQRERDQIMAALDDYLTLVDHPLTDAHAVDEAERELADRAAWLAEDGHSWAEIARRLGTNDKRVKRLALKVMGEWTT